jgi:hypothetical protein
MKHRETIMRTNPLSFKPMSPCLRLFIQSLLTEGDVEIAIEECLSDDAIVGSAAFASSAPLAVDKNYN